MRDPLTWSFPIGRFFGITVRVHLLFLFFTISMVARGTTHHQAADALVIQLDGHLDIYNLADCTPELSHGNFLLHAEAPLPAVVNVGHRD